jgi:hypothetical protein
VLLALQNRVLKLETEMEICLHQVRFEFVRVGGRKRGYAEFFGFF